MGRQDQGQGHRKDQLRPVIQDGRHENGVWGGGAWGYVMVCEGMKFETRTPRALRSGSGERQNLGAVNSFWGKKGGRSTSNLEQNRGTSL